MLVGYSEILKSRTVKNLIQYRNALNEFALTHTSFAQSDALLHGFDARADATHDRVRG
jgi:hypothetical protein